MTDHRGQTNVGCQTYKILNIAQAFALHSSWDGSSIDHDSHIHWQSEFKIAVRTRLLSAASDYINQYNHQRRPIQRFRQLVKDSDLLSMYSEHQVSAIPQSLIVQWTKHLKHAGKRHTNASLQHGARHLLAKNINSPCPDRHYLLDWPIIASQRASRWLRPSLFDTENFHKQQIQNRHKQLSGLTDFFKRFSQVFYHQCLSVGLISLMYCISYCILT